MFTTRNIFIVCGIVTALLVGNQLHKKVQREKILSELEQMYGDTLRGKRSIKHIKTDQTGVYLEVDGKEVQIPLPEGYEILKEEEYPEHYATVYTPNTLKNSVVLCGLINSDDIMNKNVEQKKIQNERISSLSIDNGMINKRYSMSGFEKSKEDIKNYDKYDNDIVYI